jgi:hypothetical protein
MDGSCGTGNQRGYGSIGFLGTLAWFEGIAITGSVTSYRPLIVPRFETARFNSKIGSSLVSQTTKTA